MIKKYLLFNLQVDCRFCSFVDWKGAYQRPRDGIIVNNNPVNYIDPWGFAAEVPDLGMAYYIAEKLKKYEKSVKEKYEEHKGTTEPKAKFQDPQRVKDTHMRRTAYMNKIGETEKMKHVNQRNKQKNREKNSQKGKK